MTATAIVGRKPRLGGTPLDCHHHLCRPADEWRLIIEERYVHVHGPEIDHETVNIRVESDDIAPRNCNGYAGQRIEVCLQ